MSVDVDDSAASGCVLQAMIRHACSARQRSSILGSSPMHHLALLIPVLHHPAAVRRLVPRLDAARRRQGPRDGAQDRGSLRARPRLVPETPVSGWPREPRRDAHVPSSAPSTGPPETVVSDRHAAEETAVHCALATATMLAGDKASSESSCWWTELQGSSRISHVLLCTTQRLQQTVCPSPKPSASSQL